MFITASALCLGGCTSLTKRMSPDVEKAAPKTEGRFIEADRSNGEPEKKRWVEDWWKVYDEPVLAKWMIQLSEANANLEVAAARVDRSLAALGVTRSALFPGFSAKATTIRQRDSLNNLLFPITMPEYSRYSLGVNASWEIDLWGRVKGMTRAARMEAEAENNRYEDVLLSLQVQLAEQFLRRQALLKEREIRDAVLQLTEAGLQIEEARLEAGDAVASEVESARQRLTSVMASLEVLRRETGKVEHSIAELLGILPSELEIPELPGSNMVMPRVPVGIPGDLLLQRPDLREADRRLEKSSIQVGVSRVGYLPRITLLGSGGVASLKAKNLFEADSGLFSIGPEVDVPVFRFGAVSSAVAQARAEWREAIAAMKSTFLTAAREVDDALLDIKGLEREQSLQRMAMESSQRAADEAKARYETGLSTYVEWLLAQESVSVNALQENQLQLDARLARLRLIQALGGVWETVEEPLVKSD